ncbi:MAG: SRPBCC family protein [Pseudomonadota bacterium]|nr:SRPBCC family protein [Pseudomonadota bacterium]
MRYVEHTTINRSRDRVIAKFDNPENLPKWQDGFVSMTQLSGTPGQAGATAKLIYRMGSRTIEMIETIEENALPNRFVATYEADGMWNRNENHFEETDEGNTEWSMLCEFRPTSLMLKVIAMVLPGMFKRQTRQNMDAFRDFVENG